VIYTPAQLVDQLLSAKKDVDDAQDELIRYTKESAEAERDYRKERARAYVQCPAGNVDAKKAWVDATTADMRFTRDLADGMRQAALELVRSRRAQLTTMQTVANSVREEAALERTAPGGGF
jgi:hypothetical protein